ncbi:MAG: hypothetical protein ACI4WX_04545 [Aristaeellaceae bacterium]
MKKTIKKVFKVIGLLLLIGLVGWRLLYGRSLFASTRNADLAASIDLPYASAMADGVLTHEEIAIHYAPQIDQAVNVLLAAGGRGDFLTAVNYDGDWSCLNNWDNLRRGDLSAVVYYSVQETDTHYYVGYYFYHPRDDAEIWLDRHENDMEGIMLCVPKPQEDYLPPEMMYVQGHGSLFFYFISGVTPADMLAGSHWGGDMALVGAGQNAHRPHVYICPNGTLKNQGHSVESAANHSAYWSVGNSGVRYVYGGKAETPRAWNGSFEKNLCSYDLRPLEELWVFRSGPYDGTGVFGSYGAFDGDNWGEDKANPPWAWRNKTIYGFGGSFLSDPVWTFNRAVGNQALSAHYVDNRWADWKLTFGKAVLPKGVSAADCTLHLFRDGWEFSNPAWFTLLPDENGFYDILLCSERSDLWVASPAGGSWRMEIRDASGQVIPGAAAAVTAEYLGESDWRE